MAEGGPELLIDAGLMAAASLRLPVVARIFHRLAETVPLVGEGAIPRTIDQAVAAIRDLAGRR